MSKVITKEEVLKRLDKLEDIHHHVVDLSNYKNMTKDKVKITDRRCSHQYEMTLKNFISGQRCPKCSYVIRSKNAKTSNDNLEIRESLSLIEFNGINKNNIYKCKKCGETHNITHKMSLSKKFKCICDVNKAPKLNKNIDKYSNELDKLNLKLHPEYFNGTLKPSIFECKCCNKKFVGYYNNIVINGSGKNCNCDKDHTKLNLKYQEILNSKKIIMEDDFVRVNHKYKFKHETCGNVFIKNLGDILYNDQGCPICASKNRQVADIKDIEEKLEKDYNLRIVSGYLNTVNSCKLQCTNCNLTFDGVVKNIFMRKDKYGCPVCTSLTNRSIGETKIKKYLISKNISFEEQKTFDNLKYKTNLKYDFFIKDLNLLIEFNGIQHYQSVEYFGGEEYYNTLTECDKLKIEYSEKNNINLLIIRYDQIDDIDKIIDRKLYEMKVSRTVWGRGKE